MTNNYDYDDDIAAYLEDLGERILKAERDASIAFSHGDMATYSRARIVANDIRKERDAVREVSEYWMLHTSMRSAIEKMMRRRIRKKIREDKRRQENEQA